MKFEIINTSDQAFIESDTFRTACITITILGNGQYGLREVDGNLKMPPLTFAPTWFETEFDIDFDTALNDTSIDQLIDAFSTVSRPDECSSLNDIVKNAQLYVESLQSTKKNTSE